MIFQEICDSVNYAAFIFKTRYNISFTNKLDDKTLRNTIITNYQKVVSVKKHKTKCRENVLFLYLTQKILQLFKETKGIFQNNNMILLVLFKCILLVKLIFKINEPNLEPSRSHNINDDISTLTRSNGITSSLVIE